MSCKSFHNDPAIRQKYRDDPSTYCILMETSGLEHESWYYFIKKEGNEENLKILADQLNSIDFCVEDDINCIDIDIDHTVSAYTAKEMCILDLNCVTRHRKFDGVLKRINFGFRKSDDEEDRMKRVNKKIGTTRRDVDSDTVCLFENYIDGEDLEEDSDSEKEEIKDEGEEEGEEDLARRLKDKGVIGSSSKGKK